MSERNYYVLCDDNCRFESMTKEQILAAITQAVESHEITDVDTGFVTKLKEKNKNTPLSFWAGTRAEFNALSTPENNCFYIITDETTKDNILSRITALENAPALNAEMWSGSAASGEDMVFDPAGYKVFAIQVSPSASSLLLNRIYIGYKQPNLFDNGESVIIAELFSASNELYVDNCEIAFSGGGARFVGSRTKLTDTTDTNGLYIRKIIGIV